MARFVAMGFVALSALAWFYDAHNEEARAAASQVHGTPSP